MSRKTKNFIALIGLGIGAGALFLVPYVFYSFYVVYQEATGYTNAQIGLLASMFGFFGVLANAVGAWLTDHYKTKHLVVVGYITTGLVGYIMATLPSFNVMMLLYALHGFCSCGIAFIASQKFLRLMGSDEEQKKLLTWKTWFQKGSALLVSAGGVVLVAMFSSARANISALVIAYSTILLIGAALVGLFFEPVVEDSAKTDPPTKEDYIAVFKNKYVWLIGLMNFMTYMVNDSLTYLQPWFVATFGVSAATASAIGVVYKNLAIVSMPLFALLAGKKIFGSVTKTVSIMSLVTVLGFVFFLVAKPSVGILVLSIAVFLIVAALCNGFNTSQWIPVSESKIPVRLSGICMGLISIITYTTDIFYFALFGKLIDDYGDVAYNWVFITSIVALVIASIAATVITKHIKVMEKEAITE